MKNLNLLLAASFVLSASSIFAEAVVIDLQEQAARITAAESIKATSLDKNPKCKFSENKQFFAVMTRNSEDEGLSVTVYNTDTKAVVITVTPTDTTIRDFEFKVNKKTTEETLVVKYKKWFKSVSYVLTVPKCKKCKKDLEVAIGAIAKAKVLGFVPAPKK